MKATITTAETLQLADSKAKQCGATAYRDWSTQSGEFIVRLYFAEYYKEICRYIIEQKDFLIYNDSEIWYDENFKADFITDYKKL